jgi:hypothetical protein
MSPFEELHLLRRELGEASAPDGEQSAAEALRRGIDAALELGFACLAVLSQLSSVG